MESGFDYLLNQQDSNGSFNELSDVVHPSMEVMTSSLVFRAYIFIFICRILLTTKRVSPPSLSWQ